MITYKLPDEKKMLLQYAEMLRDEKSKVIINRGTFESRDEAIHFAEFYWSMVYESNLQDEKTGQNSEYILEKIIISLMAYYRSSGFEEEWEEVSDRH